MAWQIDKVGVAWGFPVLTFLIACNQAYFVRLAMRARVHWLRLFLTHLLLTLGGGTLVSLLLGHPAPWATAEGGGAIASLLAAHVLFFHARALGDLPARFYRQRPLRDAWQLVAAIQVVVGAAAGAEAGAAAKLIAPTRILLALLGANGGGLLAEATDAFLQGHARYTDPIHGPGPGTVLSIVAAVVYVTARAVTPLTPQTVRALIFILIAGANFFIPGRDISGGCTRILQRLMPGFSGIWEPALDFAGGRAEGRDEELRELDMNPPPWPLDAGLFGYNVETLREMGKRATGSIGKSRIKSFGSQS